MNRRSSPVLLICLTVVIVCGLGAAALMVATVEASQRPEGWLALFLAALPGLLTTMVTLARTESIGRQVDDLANGGMDAKIRAGVADTLRPELLDPDQADQLAADYQRRDEMGHH